MIDWWLKIGYKMVGRDMVELLVLLVRMGPAFFLCLGWYSSMDEDGMERTMVVRLMD